MPPTWEAPLDRWVEHERLGHLAFELDREATRWAVRLFVAGDPLGIAIPVAYVRCKENEIGNLRLITRALVHGLPADVVEQRLVVS